MTGRLRGALLVLAAPLLALVVALLVSSVVLLANGNSPVTTFVTMLENGTTPASLVVIVNGAVPYYLSAVAVAVGFRMGLFNIGVQGQYSLAALLAAAAGAAVALPSVLHIPFVLLVAMATGAAWAGIAGALRVWRGVSEVISTIMLNTIAVGLGAYLLTTYFAERVEGSLNVATRPLPDSARFPALDAPVGAVLGAFGAELPPGRGLYGFLVVAVVVGVAYWLLVDRTRFGFDLRATGLSPTAALASGVDARRMTLAAMLLSGALAGLVGMPYLLSESGRYSLDFPPGLGFAGIGIALLGRNHPVGMAFAAVLFAFLDRSSAPLQLQGIPPEIAVIMQGTIVLAVVVAYEVVRRALVLVLLLSVARVVTGSPDLTSSGTASAALRLAVPIGLAGLGALYAERAGVVNIGLEGMLILGTWFGAYAGWLYGPWAGVALGVLGGALGGLLHAVATVGFGVDHIVSGVAINILGGGVARYLSVVSYDGTQGGGPTQSPPVSGSIGTVSLPVLSSGPDLLGRLEAQRWFLVSDVAGLARGLTAGVSLLTLVAVALVPLTLFLLWRTPFGLRLRSVGEAPVAAESLGVPVYRLKYVAVTLSGAFAGLGGAYLVTVSANFYREGQTAGRGFIGIAALIFGNWRPGGLAGGAALFGFADALQLRSAAAVHALLLFVALLLALVAVVLLVRRRAGQAVGAAAAAAAVGIWWATTETIPSQLVGFTPHLTTLIVLAVAAQRLRPPAAVGRPYRRGQQE